MALVTIDVKAAGIVQGGWNRGQAGSESNKCRCENAFYIEASGIHPPTITSTLTVSTGKTVKVSLMTFETASHTTEILASGWQDIPYTMNISSSTASKYVLCEMRNSDTSNVTPDQITAWTITYDDGIAFEIGDSGYPEPIDAPEPTEYAMTVPYTDSVFRIDSSYNGGYPFTALMPDIEYTPPPPPAPTIDPLEFYDEYNSEYLYALRQKHRRYKIRVELLGYYENVIGEITRDVSLGSSGQVTINNEQITRRSCSLNLINVEKKYLPSQDSAIWFNRKFKLWLGIEVGKKTYWWSYGVFYTQKATCDGDTVSIQGVDKGGALDGTIKTGMLDTSCIVKAGTTLTNVIKDTLMWNEFSSPYLNHRTGASAYPVDPITPIISTKFDGIRTQNEITINSNDYISTLFSSIADGYGADAYYNTNGHFCFQVMADESRIDGYRFMAHQWDFSDEDDMYSNASVDFNLDGYNVVTVYTNESDLENVSYTAANNNPASPLRLDSAGIRHMADVEIPYVNVPQSEMQARCKAYADYLLMKEAMQGMSITFSCPIIPHLDVNRTIGITDKRYNLDHATFVVNSITLPLSAEAMTVNATQTSWLPDNTGIEGGGI